MVGESRTGGGREGFDELEVVGGRDDRDVPHVGGQEGQLRLHVESGAVPPEERVHGESVAEVMRAWEMTRRGPDAGAPEECSHGAAEAPAAVAAGGRTAMPEERSLRRGWQSPPVADLDQVLDLAGGIRRQRDEARLVELGLADRQRALRRVVVSDGQLGQLSASQPGGGQHHDREAHVLGAERRIGGAGQRARGGQQLQQLDYLAVGEDMRPDGIARRRSAPVVAPRPHLAGNRFVHYATQLAAPPGPTGGHAASSRASRAAAQERASEPPVLYDARMMTTDETTDATEPPVGGGPGAAGRGTSARRTRVAVIVAIGVIVVLALVSTQVTVFVVQPIGAVPEGRTVVMSRLTNTKFIDSADAICLRIQDGVSLLCRGMVLGRVLEEANIYFRLPYSRALYRISTGGAEYDR